MSKTTKELFIGIGLSVEKAEQTLKNASLAKCLEHCIKEVRPLSSPRVRSSETGNSYNTGPETRGRGRLDCWQVSLQCGLSCEVSGKTQFSLQVHCYGKDCVRSSDCRYHSNKDDCIIWIDKKMDWYEMMSSSCFGVFQGTSCWSHWCWWFWEFLWCGRVYHTRADWWEGSRVGCCKQRGAGGKKISLQHRRSHGYGV